MRAFSAIALVLLLATQTASPAAAQRSIGDLGAEFSGEQWAECFAVFTGMATILLAHKGQLPAQGAEDSAGDGAAAGQGPADHYLALSEKAALRWLDSQGAEQTEARLMTGFERAVDRVIRTASARSDFGAYLQRTSERCIGAVNS
jgi:hypothetical protein